MKRDWIYFQNPFLTATNGSYVLAYRISLYHDNALNEAKADPFVLVLYNFFHPRHLAFQLAYNNWLSHDGSQQGNTLNVELLLKDLRIKIKKWDVFIQTLFEQGTVQYKALLPNRRSPYQSGSQTDRLNALKSLSIALEGIESLTSIKSQVDSTYSNLSTAISDLQGGVSGVKSDSTKVEAERIIMCKAQYSNMGGFIQHYSDNPSLASHFFDENALRPSLQTEFTGLLKPSETHFVLQHTFAVDNELFLDNTGTTTIEVFLALKKDGQFPGTPVQLAPGAVLQVTAPQLGDVNANHFLIVRNLDATNSGEFEIDLL